MEQRNNMEAVKTDALDRSTSVSYVLTLKS